MVIDNYINLSGKLGISGLFSASGSFGSVDGNITYTRTDSENKTVFEYSDGKIALRAEFEREVNGVVIRRDSFQNLTETEVEIYSLLSRFTLIGNDFEIYTQHNGWQHESHGEWQKLVTQVRVATEGVWTCYGATPMMGFHNLYNGKNTVFHLVPNAQWQMTVKKLPQGTKEIPVLETGFYDKALRLKVLAGEKIDLPTVIFFEAKSKNDLDAYKLHEWYNRNYPRKSLPILYNSWLYCYDNIDVDDILRQVDCAAEMGFEAFMIDAGWFGNGGNWSDSVGDWEENTVSGPKGRLIEISERVREKGMVFGLWFEPERAERSSRAATENPEFYIHKRFLDFANPDAVDFALKAISKQIDKYSIGWVKFDFNDTFPLDPSGNGFYRYMQGHKVFVSKLREKYPQLYITNCAGGGYRMELGQGMIFDSFWFSDNQGPYEGIRIAKDTIKRMPPALIERWNVQKYCGDLPATYELRAQKTRGAMISANNGTWDFLIGVNDSFTEEFLKGGPVGFSCDIDGFSKEYKLRWKAFISQYKADREFYKNATARILVDSEQIVVIEYADEKLNLCVIQIFTKTVRANDLIIYPILDNTANYSYLSDSVSGNFIEENGILIRDLKDNFCQTIVLRKE